MNYEEHRLDRFATSLNQESNYAEQPRPMSRSALDQLAVGVQQATFCRWKDLPARPTLSNLVTRTLFG